MLNFANRLSLLVILSFLIPLISFATIEKPQLKKIVSTINNKITLEDGKSGSTDVEGTTYNYSVKFIAKGGFGDVFRISIANGLQSEGLIAKVIRKNLSDEAQKAIMNLSTFQKNSHFLGYFGLISDSTGKAGILIEEAGKSLNDIYVVDKATPLPYSTLFHQMTDGILYMHEEGYGHFDVKPGNMLLGLDNTVKIIDTDDAERATVDLEKPPVSISSLGFTAPEIYNQGHEGFFFASKVDWRKSDVHALGMSFLSLLKRESAMKLVNKAIPSLQKSADLANARKLSVDKFTDQFIETVALGKVPEALKKSPLNDGSPIFKLILRMIDPNPTKGHRPDIFEVKKELSKIYP